MKVGISVITRAGQSVWENGIGQNAIHLARLFEALPFVTQVLLIDAGDQAALPADAGSAGQGFTIVRQRQATELVDVVIELAGGLELEWIDYLRARGVPVIFHCVGQPYAALIEPSVFDRDGFFSRAERCDAIWLLAKDAALAPMMRALHRCPTREVPLLWSPDFIEARMQQLRPLGLEFGYVPAQTPQPGSAPRGLRAAVFEPNISVTKCCSIPMLICDEAEKRLPGAIERLHVLNGEHLREHATFRYLHDSLLLASQGKVVVERRHDFAAYMAQHADLVVSHQWCNAQNYLYLDALYGGYPLVHNSPLLDAGYYYPDFDIASGAEQLLKALRHHDEHLSAYRAQGQRMLQQFHPHASANAAAYGRLLLELVGAQAHRRVA